MAELNLRVSNELHDRIKTITDIHNASIAEFCTKSVRQYNSGKINPVVEHELLSVTTYNGKIIQSSKWKFNIRGKKLVAILISSLLRLEKMPKPLPPKVDLNEVLLVGFL